MLMTPFTFPSHTSMNRATSMLVPGQEDLEADS